MKFRSFLSGSRRRRGYLQSMNPSTQNEPPKIIDNGYGRKDAVCNPPTRKDMGKYGEYSPYGKLLPEEIPDLLEKGDRRLTGPTMPPQGLYLNRVWYDGAAGDMMARN